MKHILCAVFGTFCQIHKFHFECLPIRAEGGGGFASGSVAAGIVFV